MPSPFQASGMTALLARGKDSYRGTAAYSEPEILLLRNFLQGLHKVKTFLSYHSFSELPWMAWMLRSASR